MFEGLKVGPRWRVTLDDVRDIAAAYGWTIPDQDIEPLGGAVNGVARIRTSRADVVVRVHRPWTTGERLDAVHAVQDDLRNHSIPIPRTLKTRAGASWVQLSVDIGQLPRLVEATGFVESDPGEISRERSDIAIAMLARLHEAMATISPGSVPEPAYSAFADPPTAISMLDETAPDFPLAADVPGYEVAVAVRERSRKVLGAILEQWMVLQPDLPRQLVHGDLQFGNILVRDTRVIGVLDFDYTAERCRVFDVAYSLYHGLTRLRNAAAQGSLTNAECEMLADQAALYDSRTHHPLTTKEMVALPFEMASVGLYSAVEAGYLIRDNDLDGAIAQTRSIERHLSLIEGLVERAAAIAEALSDHARS